MGNLIALTRDNLDELESIERLAAFLGAARFGALALQLAYEYPVKTDEPYLSIRRMHQSSVIGASEALFEALCVVCEVVIGRMPELLRVLSYRCRHENRTTVPYGLWLTLLEWANADMSLVDSTSQCATDGPRHPDTVSEFQELVADSQAMLDQEFILSRKHEGLSVCEAVESLIAHRRGIHDGWQDGKLDK